MIFKLKTIVLGFSIVFLFAQPFQDAQEVIRKVQEKYNSIEDLKADFQQISVWQLAGTTDTLRGIIYLKKENYFKIETSEQVIVTDGKSVWNLSKIDNQIVIDKFEESEDYILPKDFLFTFPKDYKTTFFEKKDKTKDEAIYSILMKAKSEDEFYQDLQIKVESPQYLIREVKLTDINENDTYLVLENIEIDTKLTKTLFQIKQEPGIEIIDMRN